MRRVFDITVSPGHYPDQKYSFVVVASTAEEAIRKAKAQGRREFNWRAAWIVHSLQHRGAAV